MAKIAIITDSTAYIPKKYVEQYDLTVLPQILIWNDHTYLDGVDITPDEFYQRLKSSKVIPSSSQVTPQAFAEAYQKLHGQGFEILVIVLSTKLSGTIASAKQAEEIVPEAEVTIVDSYTTAMAMGFQVLAAARAVEEGKSMEEVLDLLAEKRDKTGVILTPETLEYLHSGGRIGGASRFLGTALNIKPILAILDGQIEPLERIRTRNKARQRVVDLVKETAGDKPVRIAALHANDPEGAAELLSRARASMNIIEDMIGDVSPVVGRYVGPGTVALCYDIAG